MFYQSHGSSLENNTFNFTSTGSSISLTYYYTNDFAIKNNTYNIQAASTAYGIYWPSLSGYYNGTISGNKINVTSNGSTVYGIYMSSLSNINIYNNVVNTSTPSTNYTTYLTSITSGGVNNL